MYEYAALTVTRKKWCFILSVWLRDILKLDISRSDLFFHRGQSCLLGHIWLLTISFVCCLPCYYFDKVWFLPFLCCRYFFSCNWKYFFWLQWGGLINHWPHGKIGDGGGRWLHISMTSKAQGMYASMHWSCWISSFCQIHFILFLECWPGVHWSVVVFFPCAGDQTEER